MDTLKSLGIDVTLCIAGTFGCLVTIGKRAAINLRTTVASIAAGVGCANYITPAIVSSFNLQDPRWATGLAFVFGTIGLKATEILGANLERALSKKGDSANGIVAEEGKGEPKP